MSLPAFTKEFRQGKQKQGSQKSIFNLIPSKILGYDEAKSEMYRIKMLCFLASNNDARNFDFLFNECTLLYVYEILMFEKAKQHELHD